MNGTGSQHSSSRSLAGDFTAADCALAEAWAEVVPAVESLCLSRFEDCGACISLAVKDVDDTDNLAVSDWLVWPEGGEILAQRLGSNPQRSRHAALRSALQCICTVSPADWRSIDLIAEAMLAYRRSVNPAAQPLQELTLAA